MSGTATGTPRDLVHELGTEPPAGIAALAQSDRDDLAELVHGARVRQAVELQAAIEKGLSFLPRVLRLAVRKALLG